MFKVSARTVLELGAELISSDAIAFYELIKNGFDAGTQNGVELHFEIVVRKNAILTLSARSRLGGELLESLKDSALQLLNQDAPAELLEAAQTLIEGAKTHSDFSARLVSVQNLNRILVVDTGEGMSRDDLVNNFLTLGTASRRKALDQAIEANASKAPYLGEKGIGRLSAMRLGEKLIVSTSRKGDRRKNVLSIDWARFSELDALLEDIHVAPEEGEIKEDKNTSGTTIELANLLEDWTIGKVKDLVEYAFARLTDPFLDQKTRPRIVVYWNGDRITIPWMTNQLLAAAHAKVSGVYQIENGKPSFTCHLKAFNLGYDHPQEEQVIKIEGPDLVGCLAGEKQEQLHDSALVSVGEFSFEAYWYNRRRLAGIEGIGDLKSVRDLLQKWSGVLLFRDGFRVFPYGDDDDDWLALDRKAFGRSGYSLNKTQFIGRAAISRLRNPNLVDQTNREGLRRTPEQEVFVGIIQFAINDALFGFLKEMDRQYKLQKVDLSDAKEEIQTLEKRAISALKRLKKVLPKEEISPLEDIEQAFFEFKEFSEKARARISEVEQESRQMIELAGVGMMVEVVAHELARASENALENLERLRKRSVPGEIQQTLESLRAQMKSLSKRVRILDPLSISGRQRSERFDLNQLVEDTLEAHEEQFRRHGIKLAIESEAKVVQVKAVKGMIVQILENLVSNSKYWLELKKNREFRFVPEINISIQAHPPSIAYSDNGSGIAPENRERIFKPFFSLKEKSKRRGLGLFIARECAEYNGATFYLSETADGFDNRLHQFVLEFPSQ